MWGGLYNDAFYGDVLCILLSLRQDERSKIYYLTSVGYGVRYCNQIAVNRENSQDSDTRVGSDALSLWNDLWRKTAELNSKPTSERKQTQL